MRKFLLLFFSYGILAGCGLADTTSNSTGASVLNMKTQGSAPATPASGFVKVYVDTTSGLLKAKDSSGTVTSVGGVDATAILAITNTTDSSSATTGSIHTDGGLGVAKFIYVGSSGGLRMLSTTDSTSASTGSLTTLGGIGVAKSIHVGTAGNIHILATTAGSATMSPSGSLVGSLIAEGGATILKDSWINGIRIGRGLADITTNTAVGATTLNAITSGSANTAVGYQASRFVTSGVNNTALGSSALAGVITGSSNTAIGAYAMAAATSPENTVIGASAMRALSAGQRNVAVGADAGYFNSDATSLTDAETSIYIGYGTVGLSAGNNTNSIVIGTNGISEGSNTTVLGNNLTTSTSIFGATKLKGGLVRTMNAQVASYVLVADDASSIVTMNAAGANTLTIPAHADVALPVSVVIDVVQLGAGLTSIVGDVGVVVHGNLNSAGQYAGLSLMQIATDEWVVIGGVP